MTGPKSAFDSYLCEATTLENPTKVGDWVEEVKSWLVGDDHTRKKVEPELEKDPHRIRLCGLRRWKRSLGDGGNARGSGLGFEHFLHFRALVKNYKYWNFQVQDYVDQKHVDAAKRALENWSDFNTYLHYIDNYDPTTVLDNLGKFEQVKFNQNQVLRNAYIRDQGGRISGATPSQSDDLGDANQETPIKRPVPLGIDYSKPPPRKAPAGDEQIVNAAFIAFAQTLTRRFMVQHQEHDQTPSKVSHEKPGRIISEKILADWTLKRDRYDIRELVRKNDSVQAGHLQELFDAESNARLGKGKSIEVDQDDDVQAKSSARDDFQPIRGERYAKLMSSEIDGSMYCTDNDERLAIVETKKRPRKVQQLKVEWQETSQMLAWLNARLRDEKKENSTASSMRVLLKSGSGKKRCLQLAQDRECVYIIIGEWDDFYEEYALHGMFSEETLKRVKKAGGDAGFLTMNIYGPYGEAKASSSRYESMKKLSIDLLAMSMYLSRASTDLLLPEWPGDGCCDGCTCGCGCQTMSTEGRADATRDNAADDGGGPGRSHGQIPFRPRPKQSSGGQTAVPGQAYQSSAHGNYPVTPTRPSRPPAPADSSPAGESSFAATPDVVVPTRLQAYPEQDKRQKKKGAFLGGFGKNVAKAIASPKKGAQDRDSDSGPAGR